MKISRYFSCSFTAKLDQIISQKNMLGSVHSQQTECLASRLPPQTMKHGVDKIVQSNCSQGRIQKYYCLFKSMIFLYLRSVTFPGRLTRFIFKPFHHHCNANSTLTLSQLEQQLCWLNSSVYKNIPEEPSYTSTDI